MMANLDIQAMQVATDRRKQALGVADVDKLEARFSDIQLFVGMFPEDEHIRRASTELTISILNAVEHTIAFFIANECEFEISRVLIDSLTMIQSAKLARPYLPVTIMGRCWCRAFKKLTWTASLCTQKRQSHICTSLNSVRKEPTEASLSTHSRTGDIPLSNVLTYLCKTTSS